MDVTENTRKFLESLRRFDLATLVGLLAEAILNKEGRGRFRAFSAGSYPKGQVIRWR